MKRWIGCGLLIGAASMASAASGDPVHLDQGWEPAQRAAYYWTSQGSQLIPLDWFLALEREDLDQPFLHDGLARFGYLRAAPPSPRGMPIGFAVDVAQPGGREWIGLTCAACHTSEIAYLGKRFRIDGAATDADFQGFLKGLGQALVRTLQNPARLERFTTQVVGRGATAEATESLRNELAAFSSGFSRYVAQSTPDHPWGPGRLDAFGMIFNRVSATDLDIDANRRAPNAPVSYPVLWGTNHHAFTQWNASASRDPVHGYLGRNAAQLLGVFGRIDVSAPPTAGYRSSMQVRNLAALEALDGLLKSPRWPATDFGALDDGKVARGERLYRRVGCAGCHAIVLRDDELKEAKVTKWAVGTDTATLDSTGRGAGERSTGVLTGRAASPDDPRPLAARAHPGVILKHMAGFAFGPAQPGAVATPSVPASPAPAPAYKARPLNGIWASAPYLHNGSVPSLRELLLPEHARTRLFSTGSREFDPVKVGFESDLRAGSFVFDASLPGNGNLGHSGPRFGTTLSEPQRGDLLEFLKSL